jgi:imidazole glycerol-phosphate synthase subunit HisF
MHSQIPHRLISKIEVKNGYVVKGLMMEGVQRIGDPIAYAKNYYNEGSDELILLDTVASLYQRVELPAIISGILKDTFLPICAGGGIRSVDDAELLFRAGADKVCINTSAVQHPEVLAELVTRFGSQSIVSQIDVKFYHDQYRVFTNSGRDLSKYNLLEWLTIVQEQGVGEVLLTSIDKDGMSKGVDLNLAKLARVECDVPLIFGGGVSSSSDIAAIYDINCDGCAVASAFHFGDLKIDEVKNDLVTKNILMRSS